MYKENRVWRSVSLSRRTCIRTERIYTMRRYYADTRSLRLRTIVLEVVQEDADIQIRRSVPNEKL